MACGCQSVDGPLGRRESGSSSAVDETNEAERERSERGGEWLGSHALLSNASR